MKSQVTSNNQEKKTNWALVTSALLLVLSLAVMAGTFLYIDKQSSLDQVHITDASELRILSQQISKNATEAAAGKIEAFSLLKDARNEFDQRFTALKESPVSILQLPNAPESTTVNQLNSLDAAWAALKLEADNILAAEQQVLALHKVAMALAETIPQLQVEFDEIVEILLDSKAPADQIALAQRQPWLAERILNNVDRVIQGGEYAIMAADTVGRDTKLFGRVLVGMTEGNVAMGISQVKNEEAIDRLVEVADLFNFTTTNVDKMLEATPELFQVRAAADQIITDSQQLLQQTSILANTYKSYSEGRTVDQIIFAGTALIALLSLIMITVSINREARIRLAATKAQNEANQAAIMRLLDEMAELADGNLTVNATVTEDFTGAIADSINYSIEQLRLLVNTINQTAVEVDNAAQKTQSTAHQLAEASEHQATEINTATRSINEMALSIDKISSNAADSAHVAKRSLAIANNGTKVVRNTIDGMNVIREQIQDTSKRLKRLGESSQEVGNIISLINDIADQTNILSLNASIQASMAGDAGRGFAVVADEVQRLSERVSAATKQVETLVSTIQTDTNEAVISMEQTTTQVVNGAQLAQNAGVALEEIEQVSSSLAKLINDISDTARLQAESAAQISQRMKTIRDITIQTSSGTSATAGSIGDLAEMALEMRKTVSGFRLQEAES